jgi:hypothetical protein
MRRLKTSSPNADDEEVSNDVQDAEAMPREE